MAATAEPRTRRWVIATAVATAAAAGAASEAVPHPGVPPALTDVATGWTLLACGAWGLVRRPRQARWALLTASGVAWFAGNLSLSTLAYAHRGPLVNAAVAARRDRSLLAAAAVVAGYADATVVGAGHGALDGAVAALLALLAVRAGRSLAGALLALTGAFAVAATTALPGASAAYSSAALYAYEAALCAGALLLASTASPGPRAAAGLTDLVVELGPSRRTPGARDALARALDDPTLQIAYWLPAKRHYVDLGGRPVALPSGNGRAVTMVEQGGERIAALVHDAGVLDDPQLVTAVRDAAGLMLANDRLQAAAGARLVELHASRRRLVTARDAQRRRLAGRLGEGPARHLRAIGAQVRAVRGGGPLSSEQDELLGLIEGELAHARTELDELARGIHPRALTEQGLEAALAGLALRAPLPVSVSAPPDRLPPPVEAAVYFVCSEALANVAKHARATRAGCEVTIEDERVRVVVADDGTGGADAAVGSGLRGLADRVEALGGSLAITSPIGEGTCITAELPCEP